MIDLASGKLMAHAGPAPALFRVKRDTIRAFHEHTLPPLFVPLKQSFSEII
jgi:hypothetical protein